MPTNYEPLVLTIEPAYVGSAVSPTVDITETSDDVTVTITDFRGEHSYTVEKTDGAIADAEAAAANANAAATNADTKGQQAVDIATTAANNANAKAELADAAASNANTKAALADSKAALADTAAANADSKAAAANTAANTANTSASNADAKATAAQTAANAANSAASAANTAASNADAKAALADTAATNANNKATIADTAATNATTKAGLAEEAATAANTAAAAADTARESIQGDLAAKADTDGYYQLLGAGMSDALLSDDTTVDTFARRVSDHDGACRIESLRGDTVVWNQLIQPKTYSAYGMVFTTSPDGTITASGSNTSDSVRYPQPDEVVSVTEGHKYLMIVTGLNDSVSLTGNLRFSGTSALGWSPNNGTLSNGTLKYMATLSGSGTMTPLSFRVEPSTALDFSCKAMFFDLTTMFGAGNEPATVAEFERMYLEDYYPYDAGSLLSVNIEGIQSVGTTRTIPASTYFPDGMRSAGTAYDELQHDKAITRIGSRAYQSGDESDATVITDGTTTYYALATPTETAINPPLNMSYPVEQSGTESIVIPTGEQSAPPTMAIVYAYNAEGVRDISQAIIANIEGAKASTNYAIGGYFVHAGKLYKATSAIATGENITPSTNCTQTTVMAELVSLTA